MKYKLLKDLPLAKAGTEVRYKNQFTVVNTISLENGSILARIDNKDIHEWLEPIVEKKTYDDLKIGDMAFYIFDVNGRIEELPFTEDDCRSEVFLTHEEAEDEHKRREWACRKDKFIPKIDEESFFYDGKEIFSAPYKGSFGENIIINIGLIFKTKEDCQDAIDNHDLIRLFYTIR